MERKIFEYIQKWRAKGYPVDIPDVVPNELMKLGLAPSYKAICIAILNNDHSMRSLGMDCRKSEWYNVLKKIELGIVEEKQQGTLF